MSEPSLSVVVAFRELQAKIKHVELDRLAAFRERDKLLADINEKKRNQVLAKKEREMQSVDMLVERRGESDALGAAITDLAVKTELINESYRIVQAGLDANLDKYSDLEADIGTINAGMDCLNRSTESRKLELKEINERCQEMERQISLAPKFLSQLPRSPDKLELDLAALESQLEEEKRENEKGSMRADALQNYLALILQINGDLCNAVTDKELSSSKVARLSSRLISSPSAGWPQEISDFQTNSKITETRRSKKKKKRYARKKVSRNGSNDYSSSRQHEEDDAVSRASHFLYPVQGATYANTADKAAATVVRNVVGSRDTSPQRAFIPGGNSNGDSKGYNVVAAVSKASREASTLNAKVASKIKSYFADDSRYLFKGIRRVGLNDMFDHLSTIKKIAGSSGLSKEAVYNEMLDLNFDEKVLGLQPLPLDV